MTSFAFQKYYSGISVEGELDRLVDQLTEGTFIVLVKSKQRNGKGATRTSGEKRSTGPV